MKEHSRLLTGRQRRLASLSLTGFVEVLMYGDRHSHCHVIGGTPFPLSPREQGTLHRAVRRGRERLQGRGKGQACRCR